ncbi:MAG: GDSL-type esterase/lipase family protein [Kiritimatiellia bacterium]
MKPMHLLLAGLLAISPAAAAPHNPDTDWFKEAGYGVFAHFLWDVQNVGNRVNTMGKPPVTWDELVDGFDTETFADRMKEAGAGYVMFTMMQRTRYLIAPNETYEKMTGYARGEATSHRDLVLDLHASLAKRGIPLMLYWTGDGPRQDKQAADGLGGWPGKVTDPYVKNWAAVAAEYSRRYGGKVRGWWVDGCYGHIGYNNARWGMLAEGLKAGNPRAIIALNNPSMTRANSSSDFDDFTTGEVNNLSDIPDDRWRDGKQFHLLTFLGSDWGHPGCRFSLDHLAAFMAPTLAAGGVVTLDVCVFRDGSVDPAQIKQLGQLRTAMIPKPPGEPVPPGNLAFGKPARLLRQDGGGQLPANGGAGGFHGASAGVDGRPETSAHAGDAWPWTYEVDLGRTAEVNRVVVTFAAKAYATDFELLASADREHWTLAGAQAGHDGGKWSREFPPVSARFLRLRCVKPDGPNQPGGQMGVAEFEAYGRLAPMPAGAPFIETLRQGGTITIATLGTSLTGGTWAWPVVMKEWLDQEFPGRVTLHNLGVGASASSHPPGKSGLDMARKAATLKPDVVFIEFSVNDSYLPYKITLEDAKRNLDTMIDTVLAANPKAEIILQTMNTVVGEHAANRPRLEEYAQVYRDVAAARGLRLIDHLPNWKKLMETDRARFDELVPDGIHPQLPGYRAVLLPELKTRLAGAAPVP